jgi:chemotaxis response regulator CheB
LNERTVEININFDIDIRIPIVTGQTASTASVTTVTRDLIVVGASAGGVEALMRLAHALPRDLSATVCIVLHIPPNATRMLPQ